MLYIEVQIVQLQVEARISLSDPDPSSAGKPLPKHKRSTVSSDTGKVVFTPDDVRPRKKKSKKNIDKSEL